MYTTLHSISKRQGFNRQNAFTYVELLLAITITGILIAGMMGVVNTATETRDDVSQRNEITRQARFAMQRMVQNISHSHRLLLPLNDNPNTDWPEHIREQTVPATAPVGSSTLATAVLAITLPENIDLNGDGVPDADNDADGLIDEDIASDNNNDGAAGILLIDDNGDGSIDDSTDAEPSNDNDEDDSATEDPVNGIDDDADGSIDEDLTADMNNDGDSGLIGVDDDADGIIDENNRNDDDEDNLTDEDSYDSVVFYMNGTSLIERTPVPWDTNADTLITGADFIESTIAENVTRFRVERLISANNIQVIDLTLELTDPDSAESISLNTQVRLGGTL